MSRQAQAQYQNWPQMEENVLRKYLPCIPGGDVSLIPDAVVKSQALHLQTFQSQTQQVLLLQQQQQNQQQLQQVPHLDTFEEEESSFYIENNDKTGLLSQQDPSQPLHHQSIQSIPFSYNSPALTRLIIDRVIGPLSRPTDNVDTQLQLLHMRNLAQEQEKTIQRALIEGEKSKFSKKAAEFDKCPREEPQKYNSAYYSKQLMLQQQYISNSLRDSQYPQLNQDNENCLESKSTNRSYSQKIPSENINSTATTTSRASKTTTTAPIDSNFLQPRSQNLLPPTNSLRNTQVSSNSKTNTSIKGQISQVFTSQIPQKQPLLLSSFSSPSSSSLTQATHLNQRRHLSTSSSLRSSNTNRDSLQSAAKENNHNITAKLANKITKDNKNKKKHNNNLLTHNHNNNSHHSYDKQHSQFQRQPSQLQASHTLTNIIAFSPMQQSISPLTIQGNPSQQPQQTIFYDPFNLSQASSQQITQQQSMYFGPTFNNSNSCVMNPTINLHGATGYYYSQPQQSVASIIPGDFHQPNDYHNYKQLDVFEGQETLPSSDTTNNILHDSNLSSSPHQIITSNGFEEMYFCSLNESDTLVQLQHQQHQIAPTNNISSCPERYSNQQQHNRVQQPQQLQQQKQSQISSLNRTIQPNSDCNHAAANLEEDEDMLNNYLA